MSRSAWLKVRYWVYDKTRKSNSSHAGIQQFFPFLRWKNWEKVSKDWISELKPSRILTTQVKKVNSATQEVKKKLVFNFSGQKKLLPSFFIPVEKSSERVQGAQWGGSMKEHLYCTFLTYNPLGENWRSRLQRAWLYNHTERLVRQKEALYRRK